MVIMRPRCNYICPPLTFISIARLPFTTPNSFQLPQAAFMELEGTPAEQTTDHPAATANALLLLLFSALLILSFLLILSVTVTHPGTMKNHVTASVLNLPQRKLLFQENDDRNMRERKTERMLIGSTAPTCSYNECRGCRYRCRAEQIPVDGNDPLHSAYRYKCVCHR